MKTAAFVGAGVVALALLLAFAQKAIAQRSLLAIDQRDRESAQLRAANKAAGKHRNERIARKIFDPLGIIL